MARCHFVSLSRVGAALLFCAAGLAGCDNSANQAASNAGGTSAQPASHSTTGQMAAPATKPAAGKPAGQAAAQPASQDPAPLPPPPVEVRPPIIDIGTIRPTDLGKGTAHIFNVSDQPVRIIASRADCSCTSVNLANQVIPPGGSVPLTAEFKSQSGLGEKRAAVRVLFEGYERIEVPVKADVSLPVRVTPAYILASAFPGEEPDTSGEIKLTAEDSKPFRIISLNGGPVPYSDGFNPEKDAPRTIYTVRWDFADVDLRTCLRSNGERMPMFWAIETDHPDAPLIDMEIRHNCARRPMTGQEQWAIQIRRENLNEMKPGETRTIEVHGSWLPRRERSDKIELVISESSAFAVHLLEIKEVDDRLILKVQVTVNPDVRGFVTGPIRVHSKNQSWAIDLLATVRE